MIRGDNDLDKIIFDYIEGELSQDEKEVFEFEMLADEEINEQVELWKECIISQSFSDTDELEEKLILKHKRHWRNLSLNSFLSISFLLFIFPATLKEPLLKVSSGIHRANITSVENNPINENEDYKDNGFVAIKRYKKPSPNTSGIKNEEKAISSTIQEVEKKRLTWNENAMLINTHSIKKIKIKKVKRILTRKEVRAGNRKMRRDTERRIANNFKKGNVPYVVPLDGSNF